MNTNWDEVRTDLATAQSDTSTLMASTLNSEALRSCTNWPKANADLRLALSIKLAQVTSALHRERLLAGALAVLLETENT